MAAVLAKPPSARAEYAIVVQQRDFEVEWLKKREHKLQIAIAGADYTDTEGEQLNYNTVWKSRDPLADDSIFNWTNEYALGWSKTPPEKKISIVRWHVCEIGESLRLDDEGWWHVADKNGKEKESCLNVSANEMKREIWVVIGVKRGNVWEAIWFAQNSIKSGNHGNYLPGAEVQTWYQPVDRRGTVMEVEGIEEKLSPPTSVIVKKYFNYEITRKARNWVIRETSIVKRPKAAIPNFQTFEELISLLSIQKGVYFENLSIRNMSYKRPNLIDVQEVGTDDTDADSLNTLNLLEE